MTKYHVMMVTESLAGGVLEVLADLCNTLDSSLFRCTLVYSRRSETPSEEILVNQFARSVKLIHVVAQRNVDLWKDARTCLQYMRIISAEKPDILHLHSSKAGALGRLAAKVALYKSPVIYSPHGLSFLQQDVGRGTRGVYRLIEYLLARTGCTLVAVSRSEFDLLRALNDRDTVLVENGIDLTLMDSKRRTWLQQAKEDRTTLVVGTVGRMDPARDPSAFLEVAHFFRSQLDVDVQFMWIGGGGEEEEFRRKLKRLDLECSISVTGWIPKDQVWKKLVQEVDIYCHTSLWEGMPISVLEAMACELPVVARNVVGTKDVVVHDSTGFLANSVNEIAQYLLRLISQRELIHAMGRRGRKRVEQMFTIERMVKQTESLYLEKMKR